MKNKKTGFHKTFSSLLYSDEVTTELLIERSYRFEGYLFNPENVPLYLKNLFCRFQVDLVLEDDFIYKSKNYIIKVYHKDLSKKNSKYLLLIESNPFERLKTAYTLYESVLEVLRTSKDIKKELIKILE